MKPERLLDQTTTPGGQTVALYEHDGAYSIRVGGSELMSTRQHASEETVAVLGCAHLKAARKARVLIGGLGFGFTLRATLAAVPSDATVIVAELLAPVIAWNRNPELPLAHDALADRRVEVVNRDVVDVIAESAFDSIILDIDNGPAALTVESNNLLYNARGLEQMRNALRPEGCVAIWSAAPNPRFEKRFRQAGFQIEVHRARARPNGGGWHTIFLGRAAAPVMAPVRKAPSPRSSRH